MNQAMRPAKPRPSWGLWAAIIGVVGGMTLWSAWGVGLSATEFFCNIGGGGRLLRESWPPDFAFLPRLWGPFLETLQIALIGTVVGGILAIPVAVLAARPISPNRTTWFVDRNFMNVLRTMPDLFWAMLFAAAVGFGPLAGALALSVFTVAVVSKLFSESMESIDMNLPEAVRASGGTWLEMVRFSVLPQVWPQYASYVMYAFELNVRASMVLGLVGAGGIGMILNTQRASFEYERVTMIILMVLVAVLVIEQISIAVRRRLI
ncbi:phosphonate ABC transporter, permease protein PhnE [Alkalisalibacterium limincola]|uniref:Phosphonate ABC transporter, permease protein PhnE n=1 Tax=Alkalisalibacterium limincola TaxID=2699169 RepID=A0A5C8KZU9_9GAMM|nr:phosphonate ABC transporter, permease protein PhnE [Alkalisalibacterium limincola]TXK65671.1 phosphonate ABC transporter, permease protein PhnE [Alkalisalibacterium limincola]